MVGKRLKFQEQKFILWKGRQRRGRRRSPRTRHRWRGLRGAPPSASPPSPPWQKPIPDRIKLSDGSKEGAKESNDASGKRNWESVEPRLPGIGGGRCTAAFCRPSPSDEVAAWQGTGVRGRRRRAAGQVRQGRSERNGEGLKGRGGRSKAPFNFLYLFFILKIVMPCSFVRIGCDLSPTSKRSGGQTP